MSLVYAAVSAMLAIGASACSCVPPPEFPACGDDVGEIIILGEVLSRDLKSCSPDQQPEDGPQLIDFGGSAISDFKIAQVLKKPASLDIAADQVVQIRTPNNGAACGIFLEPGVEYILHPTTLSDPGCDAVATPSNLSVFLCGSNIRAPSEDQVRALAKECRPPPLKCDCSCKCRRKCKRRCLLPNGPFCRRCRSRCLRRCLE